jgi:hypothetical protein
MVEETDPEQNEKSYEGSRQEPRDDQLGEGRGKSGQQIGRENVEQLQSYVETLRQIGEQLPMHRGKPNFSAIALANGFDRGVFRDNQEARRVIEKAAKDKKLTGEEESKGEKTAGEEDGSDQDAASNPGEGGKAAHIQKKLDKSDRHNKTLEEKLAMKIAECESLKQRVKELEEKLRGYEIFEEVMTTSGRRFVP